MRTTTAACVAALAALSMRGPFTTAEAAPARHQHEARAFYPKHLRERGYNHTSSPEDTPPPPSSSSDDESSSPARRRSSSKSLPNYDQVSVVESLISAGKLPETTNSVVTTTYVQAGPHGDQTYTITYTETSSPSPADQHPKPLLTSQSVLPGTAPHDGSPSVDVTPSSAGDGARKTGHSRKQRPSPPPAPASSAPAMSSSSAAPAGGLLNSLGQKVSTILQGTPASAKTTRKHKTGTDNVPEQTPEAATPPSSIPAPTESSSKKHGLLSGLLGSSGAGPLPDLTPTPKAHHGKHSKHHSIESSSENPIIVGLSTILNGNPTKKPKNPLGLTSDIPEVTNAPKASDLSGLTGALTGVTSALGNGEKHKSGKSSDGGLLGVTSQLPGVVPGILSSGKKHKSDGGLLGVTSDVPAVLSKVTGTGGVLSDATGAVQSVLPSAVPGVLPNGKKHKSDGGLLGVTSDIPGVVPSVVPVPVPNALSSLHRTLKSKVSGILATATDPLASASLASQVSSIMHSAASDLTNSGVVPTVTSMLSSVVDSTGGIHHLPVPVPTPASLAYTLTNGGSSIVVSIPRITRTGHHTSPGVLPTDLSSVLSTPGSVVSGTTDITSTTTPDTESTATPSGYNESSSQSTRPVVTVPAYSGTAPSTSAVPATPPSSKQPSATLVDTTPTKTPHPETIKPTGTDTDTKLTLPTVWTFAPTSPENTGTTIALATSTSPSSVGALPTYMPKLVQPAHGMPSPPENTTLIQVAFAFGLNFKFVVNEKDSAGQIFLYLPEGIAYGLGIQKHQVVMNALMPYDTSHRMNYITTLAQAYIPSELVNQLQLAIHTPNSILYQNPSSPVWTLMNMINPTIPILPGAQVDGIPASSTWNPGATQPASAGGAPIGGDSGKSSKFNGTTAGIGAGAFAGAAVYAAAMVYVARRYRQKRQNHRRASSVPTAQMTQTGGGMGGFFMSGGRGSNRGSAAGSNGRASRASAGSSNGRSVREQGISAPIMSENSLGWT